VASLDNFPVDWDHPVAVVTMPDEIDIANAEDVRDTLLAVLNQGITTLIVDLTQTTFCACSGAAAFARAQQRARASGGQVRLVARAPIVRRLLAITRVDHLIPVYDSLSAARAAPVRAGPSGTEAAPAPPPPPPSRSPRPAPGA
jgi:anti-sigma B factor antagonist